MDLDLKKQKQKTSVLRWVVSLNEYNLILILFVVGLYLVQGCWVWFYNRLDWIKDDCWASAEVGTLHNVTLVKFFCLFVCSTHTQKEKEKSKNIWAGVLAGAECSNSSALAMEGCCQMDPGLMEKKQTFRHQMENIQWKVHSHPCFAKEMQGVWRLFRGIPFISSISRNYKWEKAGHTRTVSQCTHSHTHTAKVSR